MNIVAIFLLFLLPISASSISIAESTIDRLNTALASFNKDRVIQFFDPSFEVYSRDNETKLSAYSDLSATLDNWFERKDPIVIDVEKTGITSSGVPYVKYTSIRDGKVFEIRSTGEMYFTKNYKIYLIRQDETINKHEDGIFLAKVIVNAINKDIGKGLEKLMGRFSKDLEMKKCETMYGYESIKQQLKERFATKKKLRLKSIEVKQVDDYVEVRYEFFYDTYGSREILSKGSFYFSTKTQKIEEILETCEQPVVTTPEIVTTTTPTPKIDLVKQTLEKIAIALATQDYAGFLKYFDSRIRANDCNGTHGYDIFASSVKPLFEKSYPKTVLSVKQIHQRAYSVDVDYELLSATNSTQVHSRGMLRFSRDTGLVMYLREQCDDDDLVRQIFQLINTGLKTKNADMIMSVISKPFTYFSCGPKFDYANFKGLIGNMTSANEPVYQFKVKQVKKGKGDDILVVAMQHKLNNLRDFGEVTMVITKRFKKVTSMFQLCEEKPEIVTTTTPEIVTTPKQKIDRSNQTLEKIAIALVTQDYAGFLKYFDSEIKVDDCGGTHGYDIFTSSVKPLFEKTNPKTFLIVKNINRRYLATNVDYELLALTNSTKVLSKGRMVIAKNTGIVTYLKEQCNDDDLVRQIFHTINTGLKTKNADMIMSVISKPFTYLSCGPKFNYTNFKGLVGKMTSTNEPVYQFKVKQVKKGKGDNMLVVYMQHKLNNLRDFGEVTMVINKKTQKVTSMFQLCEEKSKIVTTPKPKVVSYIEVATNLIAKLNRALATTRSNWSLVFLQYFDKNMKFNTCRAQGGYNLLRTTARPEHRQLSITLESSSRSNNDGPIKIFGRLYAGKTVEKAYVEYSMTVSADTGKIIELNLPCDIHVIGQYIDNPQ